MPTEATPRTETRTVGVIDLHGTPAAALFPHAARAIHIHRRPTDWGTGATSTQTIHAITNLGHRYADAVLLATRIRGHWQTENALHWVRDMTSGEDASRIRAGHGPQNMAAIINTAIGIARADGHTNIAAARRAYAWDLDATITAVATA